MMYRNSFDDQIKNQLEGYKPSVPGHIWENINNKKKKRRPFFFFINLSGNGLYIMILLMTLATGTAYYYFKNNAPEKIAGNIVSENRQNSINSLNKSPIASPLKKDEKQQSGNVVSNSNHLNNTSNKEIEKINKDQDKNVIVINDLTNQFNSETIKNRNEVAQSETENSATTNKVNASFHSKKKNSIVDENNNLEKTEKIRTKYLTGNNQNKNITESSVNNSEKVVSTSQLEAATNSDANVNIGKSVSEKTKQELLSKRVEEMSLISNSFNFSPKLNLKNNISLSIPCPDNNNKAANKNYLDFYTSADYVLRQFNDTPNSKYLISRKESTSFSSAFSFGLRYTSVFGNGLNLRVGMNYSQINEKFSFSQGNIIQDVFIINNNGDTIGSYQTVSTRYKTSYNRYKTLDIPLTIGYEFNRNKWDFNINTGIIVNIHSWNKGAVLNESLQPVAIGNKDTNSPYQFKSNIGIGGLAAVSCYYKIGQRIKLFGEPYLRYNFSTMNKADISLKQKYHTSGIKLGLRIDL